MEILFNVHNVLGGEKTMPESRLSMELYHLMTELLLASSPSDSRQCGTTHLCAI